MHGSSPRVRGTRCDASDLARHVRIIPARAGNAATPHHSKPWIPDHPRACGERGEVHHAAEEVLGSSPRVRGTRDVGGRGGRATRIIPARAGNATQDLSVEVVGRDHPRACGERGYARRRLLHRGGSSPRVRGTLLDLFGQKFVSRIIPARAGNARARHGGPRMFLDHPRACGERAWDRHQAIRDWGSSPRVRGTPHAGATGFLADRIIPARAGNARSRVRAGCRRPDHPRACGERLWTGF